MKSIHFTLASLPLGLLVSCGGGEAQTAPAHSGPHPLDSFYLEALPAGAVEVNELMAMEDGAAVTVRGDVQEYAPVAGKAVLSLYDHALLSCDEIPGDQCKTPWDFCCTPDDEIAKNKALIEFREEGKLVKAGLGGFHGIDHLSDVVVTGTLHKDDAGNVRVLATGLHVE